MTDEQKTIEKSALLTEFAAGRLSPAEAAAIEREASENASTAAEIALQRALKETIAQSRFESEEAAARSGEFGWARLSRAIDQDASHNAETTSLKRWRYAAMIIGAVALGQTATIATQVANRSSQPAYVTVSEERVAPLAKVSFVPTASEQSIRALLRSVNGELTAGPSALGLYDVSFADEAARDAGIVQLENADDIVLTVGLD